MENSRDTQTNTVVAIAPDGDLILIVGPEEAKLHVRSMLHYASIALFGPNQLRPSAPSLAAMAQVRSGHDQRIIRKLLRQKSNAIRPPENKNISVLQGL
jgi:hypothetical protein